LKCETDAVDKPTNKPRERISNRLNNPKLIESVSAFASASAPNRNVVIAKGIWLSAVKIYEMLYQTIKFTKNQFVAIVNY